MCDPALSTEYIQLVNTTEYYISRIYIFKYLKNTQHYFMNV